MLPTDTPKEEVLEWLVKALTDPNRPKIPNGPGWQLLDPPGLKENLTLLKTKVDGSFEENMWAAEGMAKAYERPVNSERVRYFVRQAYREDLTLDQIVRIWPLATKEIIRKLKEQSLKILMEDDSITKQGAIEFLLKYFT